MNRAFEGLGRTRDFYKDVFDRDSLDGRGMRLNGYVHYDEDFNNAFWDGSQMLYGDGFAAADDVVGHELDARLTQVAIGDRDVANDVGRV